MGESQQKHDRDVERVKQTISNELHYLQLYGVVSNESVVEGLRQLAEQWDQIANNSLYR